MKLSDGERHSMVTVGNRHRLLIQPVEKKDFGNYSCVSENLLGKAKGPSTRVTLTGQYLKTPMEKFSTFLKPNRDKNPPTGREGAPIGKEGHKNPHRN